MEQIELKDKNGENIQVTIVYFVTDETSIRGNALIVRPITNVKGLGDTEIKDLYRGSDINDQLAIRTQAIQMVNENLYLNCQSVK